MGRFPSELVQPAAAPDFLQLPAEPGRGRAAAVAAAVASAAAAREVGRRREVRAGQKLQGRALHEIQPIPCKGLAWRAVYGLEAESTQEVNGADLKGPDE